MLYAHGLMCAAILKALSVTRFEPAPLQREEEVLGPSPDPSYPALAEYRR